MPHQLPDHITQPDGSTRYGTMGVPRPAEYKGAWNGVITNSDQGQVAQGTYERAFTATFFQSLVQQGFSGIEEPASADGTIRLQLTAVPFDHTSTRTTHRIYDALLTAHRAGIDNALSEIRQDGPVSNIVTTREGKDMSAGQMLSVGAAYATLTLMPTEADPNPVAWDDVLGSSTYEGRRAFDSQMRGGAPVSPPHTYGWRDGTDTGRVTADVGAGAGFPASIAASSGVEFSFAATARATP